MKFVIDTDENKIMFQDQYINLYSKQGFELISQLWNKVGWNEKYAYTFTWMGRPIIQLPEDMVRTQEIIYDLKPDVIIETGVAHGGSLVFYASLCKAMGNGKVIGIDIEIRPHNRKAIEEHELFPYITLFEGSSTEEIIIEQVKHEIPDGAKVLVILDSNHSKQHVLNELELYSTFVTKGSFIVATDGIMKDLEDVPSGGDNWSKDNPYEAVLEFLSKNEGFVMEQPSWKFNESNLDQVITHWPGAWIKKL